MTRSMDRLSKRFNDTRAPGKESGFTLIELLIVIVILGILAGIAIFALGGFKQDATNACNDANARIDATVSAAQAANGAGTATKNGDCNS